MNQELDVKFDLPLVNNILGQLYKQNLVISQSLDDSGSEISLTNVNILRSSHINTNLIEPLFQSYYLKGGTGKVNDPFLGIISIPMLY